MLNDEKVEFGSTTPTDRCLSDSWQDSIQADAVAPSTFDAAAAENAAAASTSQFGVRRQAMRWLRSGKQQMAMLYKSFLLVISN